jgi:hypothetical protein
LRSGKLLMHRSGFLYTLAIGADGALASLVVSVQPLPKPDGQEIGVIKGPGFGGIESLAFR